MEHLITAMVVRTDDLPERLHVVDDARALLIRHGWVPPAHDVVLDPADHGATSFAHTEARTVLSRAETALARLDRPELGYDRHSGIEEALTTTVVALEPYRRTRRRRAAA